MDNTPNLFAIRKQEYIYDPLRNWSAVAGRRSIKQ